VNDYSECEYCRDISRRLSHWYAYTTSSSSITLVVLRWQHQNCKYITDVAEPILDFKMIRLVLQTTIPLKQILKRNLPPSNAKDTLNHGI
jgi:hypothetical protein